MFYSFQNNLTKIGRVTLICNTSWFFVTRPIFSYDLTLSRYKFKTEARSPKPTIFSESWVRKDSVVQKFSRWNFRVWSVLQRRIHFFANFCVPTGKYWARVRSILLMSLTSHIASFNRHAPKFSVVPQKLSWCQPFGVQGIPKSGNPDSFPPKNVFFAKNRFSWPNSQHLPIACHTCSESYWFDGSFGKSGDPLRASVDPSDFCNIEGINWHC